MFSRLLRTSAGAFLAFAAPLALAVPVVQTPHVEAQLVSDQLSAQPGKPVLVGLKLRMIPDWHTYWKNPGDSGLPTRIHWELPPGWQAAPIRWPYPTLLPVGPLMNYGYEDDVVLLSELTPPADAPSGKAEIRAHAEWLVCKDICVPEKGDLDLALPVSPATPKGDRRFLAHIQRAQEMLPVDLAGWTSEAAIVGKSLVVRIAAPQGATPPAKVTFFPEQPELIEPAAPEKVSRDGRFLTVQMKLADPAPKEVHSVHGVAVAHDGWPGTDQRRALEVAAPVVASLPVAAAGTIGGASANDGGIGGSLFAALAFAFLGGLILNLMPCVFPVLGIKVMGFVRHAHGDARAMRLQGILFAIGVLASFATLAAILLALRAGGSELGWGFQLQSPAVVAILACLFFVLALNLAGLFEWGGFAQSMTSNVGARGRYADAFLSGVLATVVATPCTAPFMGAAVGFTLTQSAALAFTIFLALGCGVALPVLLLALFPALLRRLPKPGRWMEAFKQLLAFPLFATSAWLAWVLGAQAGNDAVLALLLGLVILGLAAWMYGRWAHAGGRWQPVLAVVLGALGIFVAWPAATGARASNVARADEEWPAWSPEKVQEYLAQGRPVFVDFTAAWCVTCQVNKRVALRDAAVDEAFARRNVARLTADWTRQDQRITEALAALGRNAVPVYALYSPGASEPRLLPELLTPSIVIGALAKLPRGDATAVTRR